MEEKEKITPNEGVQNQDAQSNVSASPAANALKAFGVDLTPSTTTAPAEGAQPETVPSGSTQNTPPVEQVSPENADTNVAKNVEEQKTEEKEDKTINISSPIYGEQGLNIGVADEPKDEGKRSFETLEEFNSFVKDEFGVEDLGTLSEKYKSFQEMSEEHSSLKGQYANVERIFDQMPKDLYQAVVDFSNGRDWRESIKDSVSFDFSKEADSQNEKALLDHFAQGKITDEEWKEFQDPEGDEATKKAVNAYLDNAKEKYNAQRDSFNRANQDLIEQAKADQERVSGSIEKSISYLSSNMKGVDKSYVKEVSDVLRNNAIAEIFFNEDGTYREDAALRISMAKHGYDLVNELQRAAAVSRKNEETQDILSRTSDRVESKGRAQTQSNGGIRPEVAGAMEKMNEMLQSKQTY